MSTPLYCPSRRDPLNQSLLEKLAQLDWVVPVSKPSNRPFLIIEEGRLGLADPTWPKVLPVMVDFVTGSAAHRRQFGGGVGQAVAKAVALNKRKDLSIWDATAGLGRDAFVMASLGANVTLFERHPVVRLLLEDGLSRLSLSGDPELQAIASRLTLAGVSIQGFSFDDSTRPDVVYLDPMFPERGKKAKVKKDMSLFHTLVGADEDADALLAPALEAAVYRVVVKRSKSAPELAGTKPVTALLGKSSRFDIYSKKAIA